MRDDPIGTGITNPIDYSLLVAHTPRMAKPWMISDLLVPFMGEWESGPLDGANFAHQKVTRGMILKVYLDSKRLPTVGLGHLVKAVDKLKVGDEISLDRANAFFRQDLSTMEATVNAKINVPLYQYEYDALVDVTYNTGEFGGIDGVARIVNIGSYRKVSDFIVSYRTGGGNSKRRASEAALFKSGLYDAAH